MSRVFIIDDDPIHQRIAQIMIEKHRIYDEFKSYTEAGKALEFLQENHSHADVLPDVILLDLNMPVVDGWDFLEKFDVFRSLLIDFTDSDCCILLLLQFTTDILTNTIYYFELLLWNDENRTSICLTL